MKCDKCKRDLDVNCILEMFDNDAKNWKVFHLCGYGCLVKFIVEYVKEDKA